MEGKLTINCKRKKERRHCALRHNEERLFFFIRYHVFEDFSVGPRKSGMNRCEKVTTSSNAILAMRENKPLRYAFRFLRKLPRKIIAG